MGRLKLCFGFDRISVSVEIDANNPAKAWFLVLQLLRFDRCCRNHAR